MADFVWPEDSGTGSSSDDYADAANFAAHRHSSPLTDYVEAGMNITVDWANDQFDVSSGMAFISDGSASLTQKTETRDHGVTYAVGINSRTGISLANANGMNDVIVTCDPNNGPDNVTVAAIDPGTVYGDPHVIIGKLDGSSNTKEETNRRPHLEFGGGEVQNCVYAENFNTLQAAVDHAENNSNPYYHGYVFIPPGQYDENITLHRRTKLIGNASVNGTYDPGDTQLTGTIDTKEANDSTNSSWAIGMKNIVLNGATVNIVTGSSMTVNRFENISMRNEASFTADGVYNILDGFRCYYDSNNDAAPPSIHLKGNGDRLSTCRGTVDITIDGHGTVVEGISGVGSAAQAVQVNGALCHLSSVWHDVDLNGVYGTLEGAGGAVGVNANKCQVSTVDGTVTLDASNCTVSNVNDVTFSTGSHNYVSNVNSATSATIGTSDNYLSGFNAALTVDGDDNYIEGVEGNITVNGENNLVTKCGEWDSANLVAAYTIDVAGVANHVMGCTADVTIQTGGGYSYVSGVRGDCTVNPSGCTVVHVTGTFTDNDGGTATLGV